MAGGHSDDAGSVQVLEAVLVAIIMITAVSFVVTFSLPSSENTTTRDQLGRQGDQTLAILYDMPLNDPAYGNSTLSKYVADAFQNDPENLTRRLNTTLPPGVAYSLYVDNGYGSLPVYEPRDPTGETVTVSRLFEPRWSYTWLLTDVDHYTGANRMGVYGLPVIRSLPLTDGGAPVEITVHGQRLDALQGNTRYTLSTSHSVMQLNKSVPATLPHATITFINDTGAPVNYVDNRSLDNTGSAGATATVTLRLNETEGVAVPAGTRLTVHTPRGWTAKALDDATWDVLENATDTEKGDALVAELKNSVVLGTADLDIDITFEVRDDYDFYTFRARLGSPAYSAADLVVHRNRTLLFTGGDFPVVRATVPKAMGQTGWGVWSATVTNPVSYTGQSRMRVDSIEVVQPDGDAVFGDVDELREAVVVNEAGAESTCLGTWARVDASTLRWTSDDDCAMGVDSALHLAWRVKSAGVGTALDSADPLNPPVKFGNEFEGPLVGQTAHGFYHESLPPEDSPLLGWKDACPDAKVECALPITSSTVHNTIPLEGRTTYRTKGASVSTFRDAIALSDTGVSPRKAPLGETVTITSDVKPLLLAIQEEDLPLSQVTTRIYPPWAVGERIPVVEKVHEGSGLGGEPIEFVATHDLDGDGSLDVIVATAETKVYGLDGETGVQLAGYAYAVLGQEPTDLQVVERAPGDTVIVLTTTPGMPNVHVLDADTFAVEWTASVGSSGALDADARFDFTGNGVPLDGLKDVSVGLESGSVYVLSGADGSTILTTTSVGQATRVAQGHIGKDADESTIATLGPEAGVTMRQRSLDQSKNTVSKGKVDEELAAQIMRPTLHTRGAAIRAWNTTAEEVWNAAGGDYDVMATHDVDGDGITDIVGGDWDGAVHLINGSQASSPYATESILSGNTVRDIQALDRDHVYTVSFDGAHMFTNDSWTNHAYYTEGADLNFLQFQGARGLSYVDTDHGWIVGINGRMWNTSNGPYEYEETGYDLHDTDGDKINLQKSLFLWEDIAWSDTSGAPDTWKGYVYGGDCRSLSLCTTAAIAATTDGGATWRLMQMDGDESGRHLHDVQFLDATTGFAVGENGTFYEYYEPGVNEKWTRISVKESGGKAFTGNIYGLHAWRPDPILDPLTVNVLVVGENGTVYKGVWEGRATWTWTKVDTPTAKELRDVEMVDNMNGVLIGKASTVLRTYDGGDTWVRLSPPYVDADATGIHYYAIDLVTEQQGWFAGGNADGTMRLIGHLHTYDTESVAQTNPINDPLYTFGVNLKGVTSANITTDASNSAYTNIDYFLSNDNCETWVQAEKEDPSDPDNLGIADWTFAEFPDPTGDSLCLRLELWADPGSAIEPPLLRNISITYNYTLNDGTEGQRTLDFDLSEALLFDMSATTADWNRDDSTLRPRLVNKFWLGQTQADVAGSLVSLHGSEVRTLNVADLTRDGTPDVVVGSGDAWPDSDKLGEPLGTDRRVYVFNGTTGTIDDVSNELPGVVTALHLVQLPALTGDNVPDVIVAFHDPGLYSTAVDDDWGVMALNGSDLKDVLWFLDEESAVNDITTADLDADSLPESVYVTDERNGEAAKVLALHPEADDDGDTRPDQYWLALPDVVSLFRTEYNVPMHSLYGPFIAETEVAWEDTTGVTQKARLYDYFVVTPPNGKIPVSPIYRVDLVLWYEDWG